MQKTSKPYEQKTNIKLHCSFLEGFVVNALALYGMAVLLALLLAPLYILPAEDAVILFQYSQNLAHHGAITYYFGGPHAEGATDFAWMLLIACVIRLGAEPFIFVSCINACTLVALAAALLRLGHLRVTMFRILIFCGVAGMAPQIVAAIGGFAVLPDALLLVLLVLLVDRQQHFRAATAALALCFFRPDGVVFAIPLLTLLLIRSKWSMRAFTEVTIGYVIPGAIYFLWRFHYFGALFPLPFYVKSDTPRFLSLIELTSFEVSLKYIIFGALVATVLVFRKEYLSRARGYFAGLVIVPTLFYWHMRLSQNLGERFYFYLPLAVAIATVLFWKSLEVSRRRLLTFGGIAAWLIFLLPPLLTQIETFREYQFPDVRDIARDLRNLPRRGTMLTSEAGWLAYESEWIIYDAWGLNTMTFAKRLIQPSDVVALRPDLIVLHPNGADSCVPSQDWPRAYSGRSWPHFTRNVSLGVQDAGGYELRILSYGSPHYRESHHWNYGQGDRECFFVRSDSDLREGIKETLIRHHAVAGR